VNAASELSIAFFPRTRGILPKNSGFARAIADKMGILTVGR
jgi:hypothetical protein